VFELLREDGREVLRGGLRFFFVALDIVFATEAEQMRGLRIGPRYP
jgi:hypothetical protein